MNGVAAQTPQMLALFGDAEGRERISKFRQRLLERGRIADGAPIPSSRLVPPSNAEAAVEAQKFRSAVERFNSVVDLLPDHPGLGPMIRFEW